ncbi:MAG: signal recognition particle protein [Bacillota bacterium]|jgi:signal recognition particle subunit SRP54|nr:signal recognition particle protein [Bacillota bacterium]
MVFESLQERLQVIFKRLRGKGKITEADVNEGMREIRIALLEADVNFKVVRDFINRVKERALGQDVTSSLTPGQAVIKIVHDELTALMGGAHARLNFAPKPPTVIMLAGLQGSGKTTTAAKLAIHLKGQGRRPALVACDVYRPAAVQQLQVVGKQAGVPVFAKGDKALPVDIARESLDWAASSARDVVILDTAGRLHIDDEMMQELERVKAAVHPHEILLVVDAMTGQEAVSVAETFNRRLDIDGIILTKLDGDSRGGAALSVKAVTGKPIKFAGTGEKLDGFEPFHPDRMASRILGMGDMLSLIEKAEAVFDADQAKELERKMRAAEFTLQDFMDQLKQVRNMGPLDQLLSMVPGFSSLKKTGLEVDEKELSRVEAMINSMTVEERRNSSIIGGSRRRRIAAGSGSTVQDVNRLLKQFEQAKKMFRAFASMEKGPRKGMKMPFLP